MQKGLFIVSLDFELMWGVRDKRTIASYGANIRGVRQVIPSLLQKFEQYGVAATFATVGFLFARDRDELLHFRPDVLPDYPEKKYSPYENGYMDSIGRSEEEDIYHFGRSLVEMTRKHPLQELATHTFSHYYCLENASIASFEADLKAAIAIAHHNNIDISTIVFPRNQYSAEHLDVCKRNGIIAYRGNERSAVYNPRKNEALNASIRATRLADSYVNLTGQHTFRIRAGEMPVNTPASRFLRPFAPSLKFAESLRLARIKNSMTHAARQGEAYHLWWHPHNFGVNLQQNLAFLDEILKHYRRLHQELGMQSKTMKTIAEEILQPHAI